MRVNNSCFYSLQQELLFFFYQNSLELAVKNGIKKIAFPNISTGVYRFPKELAAQIAIKTVSAFTRINSSIKQVIFVCFTAVFLCPFFGSNFAPSTQKLRSIWFPKNGRWNAMAMNYRSIGY